jgi:hypothetical protein
LGLKGLVVVVVVIEVKWGLYIGYVRETLDYNIIIIILTIVPFTPLKCNGVACEEFIKHTHY